MKQLWARKYIVAAGCHPSLRLVYFAVFLWRHSLWTVAFHGGNCQQQKLCERRITSGVILVKSGKIYKELFKSMKE